MVSLAFVTLGVRVVTADPASVPSWMSEHNHSLLPPVDAKVLTRMQEAWPKLRATTDVLVRTPDPLSYRDAARTVGELGEQAGLALIWMYVADIPIERELWKEAGREKQSILSALSRDPIAGKWMIPILRERMGFISSFIEQDPLDAIPVTIDEFMGIEGYLIAQGTPDDLRRYQTLYEEVRLSSVPWAHQLPILRSTKEEKAVEDAARRRAAQENLHPFFKQFTSNSSSSSTVESFEGSTSKHATGPTPSIQDDIKRTDLGEALPSEGRNPFWIGAGIFLLALGAWIWWKRARSN
jgi:hypothetical protein